MSALWRRRKLTEHLRRHPASVVLFGKQKAHRTYSISLLQILEEGVLTDAEGQTAHFRESIVILTSNIGTESFLKDSSFGFGDIAAPSFESLQKKPRENSSAHFAPSSSRASITLSVFPRSIQHRSREVAAKELDQLAENMKRRNIASRSPPCPSVSAKKKCQRIRRREPFERGIRLSKIRSQMPSSWQNTRPKDIHGLSQQPKAPHHSQSTAMTHATHEPRGLIRHLLFRKGDAFSSNMRHMSSGRFFPL